MSIKAAQLKKPLAAGEVPVAQVEVQNTGHSPAMRVVFMEGSGLAEQLGDSKDIPRNVVVGQPSVAVLGPGTPMSNSVALNQEITGTDLEQLRTNKKRVYSLGWIEYDDIFGKRHQTEFCFFTVPDLTSQSMVPCHKWNKAD